MTPVDGIRAPRTKRTTTAGVSRSARKTTPLLTPVAPVVPSRPIPEPTKSAPGREKMVWAIAIGITGVIFVIWVILFSGGSLKSTNDNSSFWARVSDRLNGFIETVQTDWLHLKKDLNQPNTNAATVDEARIKQLEEQVFPQFQDPTKQ